MSRGINGATGGNFPGERSAASARRRRQPAITDTTGAPTVRLQTANLPSPKAAASPTP
ncbi:MAG: hypothetical protein IPN05_19765 [Sulfuritalea sp.]|nr:hypothetical protein [Sulfuritalea sp.]